MKVIGFFNLLNSGLAFIGSFVLVKLLGSEVFGNYYFLVSTATILYTIIEFGISNEMIVNKLIRFEKNKFAVERSLIIRIISLCVIVILAFPIFRYFDVSNALDVSLVISLTILLFINKIIQTLFQSIEKWVLWGLIGLAAPLAKFLSLYRIDTYILNNVILQTIILLSLLFYCVLKVRVYTVDKEIKISKAKWLFAFTNIITIFMMRLDILWIKNFLDDNLLGIYAFSSTVALAGPVIIGTSINTYFTKYFSDDLDLKSLYPSKGTIILIITITVLGMLISNPLISFFMGEEKVHGFILPMLIFTYCFGIVFARFEPFFLNYNLPLFLKIRIAQLLLLFGSFAITELLFETNLTNIVLCIFLSRLFYWTILPFFVKKIKVNSELISNNLMNS